MAEMIIDIIIDFFLTLLYPGIPYFIACFLICVILYLAFDNVVNKVVIGLIGSCMFCIYSMVKSLINQNYSRVVVYSLPVVIYVYSFVYHRIKNGLKCLRRKRALKNLESIIEKYLNKYGIDPPFLFANYIDKKYKRESNLFIGRDLCQQYYPKRIDCIHVSGINPDLYNLSLKESQSRLCGILVLPDYISLQLYSCYPKDDDIPESLYYKDLIVAVYQKKIIHECEEKIANYACENMFTLEYLLCNIFDGILEKKYSKIFHKRNWEADEQLKSEMIVNLLIQLEKKGLISRIQKDNDMVFQPARFKSKNVVDKGTFTLDD